MQPAKGTELAHGRAGIRIQAVPSCNHALQHNTPLHFTWRLMPVPLSETAHPSLKGRMRRQLLYQDAARWSVPAGFKPSPVCVDERKGADKKRDALPFCHRWEHSAARMVLTARG